MKQNDEISLKELIEDRLRIVQPVGQLEQNQCNAINNCTHPSYIWKD